MNNTTKRTKAEMKKSLEASFGKPSKENPFWFNSNTIKIYRDSVEREIADDNVTPRSAKALTNWVDKLETTYLR